MSPAQFVELLIAGLNVALLLIFLAWRFCGPGRTQHLPASHTESISNKDARLTG